MLLTCYAGQAPFRGGLRRLQRSRPSRRLGMLRTRFGGLAEGWEMTAMRLVEGGPRVHADPLCGHGQDRHLTHEGRR